jgi:hypothetical protein
LDPLIKSQLLFQTSRNNPILGAGMADEHEAANAFEFQIRLSMAGPAEQLVSAFGQPLHDTADKLRVPCPAAWCRNFMLC